MSVLVETPYNHSMAEKSVLCTNQPLPRAPVLHRSYSAPLSGESRLHSTYSVGESACDHVFGRPRASSPTMSSKDEHKSIPSQTTGFKRARGGKYIETRSRSIIDGTSFHCSAGAVTQVEAVSTDGSILLPPSKRTRYTPAQLLSPAKSLTRSEPRSILRKQGLNKSKGSVRFHSEVKVHDGQVFLHGQYERVVTDFFAGVAKLNVPTPVPGTPCVRDRFTKFVPLKDFYAGLPLIEGKPITRELVDAVLLAPEGHVLAAWDRIERSAYGTRLAKLQEHYPLLAIGLALQGKEWKQIEDACTVCGVLGLDVDVDGSDVVVVAPGNTELLLTHLDQQILTSVTDITGHQTLSPTIVDVTQRAAELSVQASRPGWVISCVDALERDTLHATAPCVSPPEAYAQAVTALAKDRLYGDGSKHVLRGIHTLVEDLDYRLRLQILLEACQKYLRRQNDSAKDEEASQLHSQEEEDLADLNIGDIGLDATRVVEAKSDDDNRDKDTDDEMERFSHAAMTKANLLVDDASATAAAAAFRERQESISVPILKEGGGMSCKLGPQHLLLVHQLKMLLNHAVHAYPCAY